MARSWLPGDVAFTSWNMSKDGSGMKVSLPDGVAIQETSYGHGVFATKPFSEGQVIWATNSLRLPFRDGAIQLKTDGGSYQLNMIMHFVEQESDGLRQVYSFHAFTNHSCNPNSFSSPFFELSGDGQRAEYAQVAARDIKPGTEITYDYDLFEWECSQKGIENCACGEACCRGRVAGFKVLCPKRQRQLLPVADNAVIKAWLAVHPEVLFRFVTLPPHLNLSCNSDLEEGGWTLVFTQQFKEGDFVMEHETEMIDAGIVEELIVACPDPSWEPVKGSGIWTKPPLVMKSVDILWHTINRGNGRREFYGFDTFCQHSCDPNMRMEYLSENRFKYHALKAINVGDEMTCDYEAIDSMLDGTVFACSCGAQNCRKQIRG